MIKPKILSLFTGGGFLDMGFEQAGFETVFTNEFDTDFATLYKAGMSSWASSSNLNKEFKITSTESIASLSPDYIKKNAFPNGTPPLWGIIGGPPCQDFSMNGTKNGFNGNRGKMTVIFFNRVVQLQPSFFLMENVPGLIRNKSSKEQLEQIIKNHCSKEYEMNRFVLNALDYGVPQYRERVFIIGIRKDLLKSQFIKNPKEEIYNLIFPIPKSKYVNAKKTFDWPYQNKFGENPQQPNSIPIELTVSDCLITKEDIDNRISNIDEYFPLRKNVEEKKLVNEGDTARSSFKRLHRYRYSPTTCYGNNEVHLHPFENRRISVREALRIQGVPDSYSLPKHISKTKKFKMIGNGVPVPLAYNVAITIKMFLYNL